MFGGSIGLATFNANFASGLTKNLVPKVTVPLGLPMHSVGIAHWRARRRQ